MRSVAEMHAVRQGEGEGDLSPQGRVCAHEEGDPTSELRQRVVQGGLDTVESELDSSALALTSDRFKRRAGEASKCGAPGATDAPVGAQLQVETDHGLMRRFDFGKCRKTRRR